MIKKYNIIVTVILLIFLLFTFKECKDNKEFKDKISDLERSKDSLKGLYQKQVKTSDSLFKIKNKTIIEYQTIYKYLKPIQDEQSQVDSVVYSLDERKIDSTIRSYKHPVRN